MANCIAKIAFNTLCAGVLFLSQVNAQDACTDQAPTAFGAFGVSIFSIVFAEQMLIHPINKNAKQK